MTEYILAFLELTGLHNVTGGVITSGIKQRVKITVTICKEMTQIAQKVKMKDFSAVLIHNWSQVNRVPATWLSGSFLELSWRD